MVKLAEAGFDLTGFPSVKAFKSVLKQNKMRPVKTKIDRLMHGEKHYVYRFKGKGIEMRTGNNPITGKYSMPKQRKPEKGFASYIGIKGDKAKVQKLTKSIRKATRDIKEFNPRRNDFIW